MGRNDERKLFAACETTNPGRGAILNKNDTLSGAGLFGFGNLYGGYHGGQAEFVRVPKADVGPLVIPDSALINDIHGGVWVYEQTAPHTFARRRVEVRDTQGGLAVLTLGPQAGAKIVVTGAAELYGVEFGAGK